MLLKITILLWVTAALAAGVPVEPQQKVGREETAPVDNPISAAPAPSAERQDAIVPADDIQENAEETGDLKPEASYWGGYGTGWGGYGSGWGGYYKPRYYGGWGSYYKPRYYSNPWGGYRSGWGGWNYWG